MATARGKDAVPSERGPATQEVVLGEYETVRLPVGQYVLLPQVRDRVNANLDTLATSIDTNNLVNQPDVAPMTVEQLDAHLRFINAIWGTNVTVEDYQDRIQPDGLFYVVIAGHSRFTAIAQLQRQHAETRRYSVVAKIHWVSSSEEFLALQLAENTYDKPSEERRAMAIVEMYLYGIRTGKWADEDEFLHSDEGKKIDETVLADAIGFAQLPPRAREFVFAGRLPYSTSVAIGKAAPAIRAYAAAKLMGGDGQPTPIDLDVAYDREVGLIIEHIYTGRLGTRKARAYVEETARNMVQQVGRMEAEAQGDFEQTGFPDFDAPRIAAEELYRRGLKTRYAAALARMARTSITDTNLVLSLHRELYGAEAMDRLRRELDARYSEFGGLAVEGAVYEARESSASGRLVGEVPIPRPRAG